MKPETAPTLFDPPALARRRNPQTSHDAARRVAEFGSEHHRKILAAFTDAPAGLTAYEISEASGLAAHAIGKRLGELEKAGKLEVLKIGGHEVTRPTPTGRSARVWMLVRSEAKP